MYRSAIIKAHAFVMIDENLDHFSPAHQNIYQKHFRFLKCFSNNNFYLLFIYQNYKIKK